MTVFWLIAVDWALLVVYVLKVVYLDWIPHHKQFNHYSCNALRSSAGVMDGVWTSEDLLMKLSAVCSLDVDAFCFFFFFFVQAWWCLLSCKPCNRTL